MVPSDESRGTGYQDPRMGWSPTMMGEIPRLLELQNGLENVGLQSHSDEATLIEDWIARALCTFFPVHLWKRAFPISKTEIDRMVHDHHISSSVDNSRRRNGGATERSIRE
ncbi:hypothetical protein MRX96_021887 [Rhipicephalus microplus]